VSDPAERCGKTIPVPQPFLDLHVGSGLTYHNLESDGSLFKK
jgi:hypothetical protein